MKNWKTTLAGIGMILSGAGTLINDFQAGTGINMAAITNIIGGIGFLCAKDQNVTGGTVKQ